jgi:LysM repeat protein
MRDQGRPRSPARLVAPLALLVVIAATVLVVASSTDSNGGDDGKQETTARGGDRSTRNGRQEPRRPKRATYRVKLNDTLGLISEKTGVSVERLQALNPDLDPQNLVVGQRIKLRE